MKVLFVATVVKTHINAFHLPFLQMFKNNGWKTSVCARNDFENTSDCVIPYCDTYYDLPFERSPFKLNNLKTFFKLRKIIKKEKFDIVHCHTPSGGVLSRIAAVGLRRRGLKVIYTAHGFHFYKGAPLINWLLYFPIEWVCSFLTDTLITINKEDFEFAKKYMHAKEITYVPGVGIDAKSVKAVSVNRKQKRNELGINENEIAVLSVGELNDNKNHETVLQAIGKTGNKNIVYIICGEGGQEEHLKQLAGQAGVRLILLGYRNDITQICKSCDIFAFPSKREGLSKSLMEAMVAGLPVVCSKIRGNVDLIDDETGGYLCAPMDVDSFAQKIQILCENGMLRKNMAEENIKKVEDFSMDTVRAKMKMIYNLPVKEKEHESTSFAAK